MRSYFPSWQLCMELVHGLRTCIWCSHLEGPTFYQQVFGYLSEGHWWRCTLVRWFSVCYVYFFAKSVIHVSYMRCKWHWYLCFNSSSCFVLNDSMNMLSGDLGVRKGMMALYGLPKLPSQSQVLCSNGIPELVCSACIKICYVDDGLF